MDPELLSLEGRVEHAALEDAVDAIQEGRCPGWQVAYDEIGLEMVAHGRRDTDLKGFVSGVAEPIAMLTRLRAESPQRVWVIVLEQPATGRQEVLKFLLLGGDDEDNPTWVRIRPDASTPVPAAPEELPAAQEEQP